MNDGTIRDITLSGLDIKDSATGLIDIITNGIKRGEIDESGYMEDEQIDVCENVSVTDKDVRELQLAKSAIRAVAARLVSLAGIGFEDIEALFVSGGFSASIRPTLI